MSERGTCPKCGKKAGLGGRDGRIVLAHSVPRHVYKDGRGCRGAGRVAVEKRKTPLVEVMSEFYGSAKKDADGAELRWVSPIDDRTLVIRRAEDGSWPDWVMVGMGWTQSTDAALLEALEGLWRERPR